MGFLKSIIAMLIFAPFYFLHDISVKIVFLKKEIIVRILQTAAALSFGFTVVLVAVKWYFGVLTILGGTIPIIVPLCSSIILLLSYVVFDSVDLALYSELMHMFPTNKPAQSSEEATFSSEELAQQTQPAESESESVSESTQSSQPSQPLQPTESTKSADSGRALTELDSDLLSQLDMLVSTPEQPAQTGQSISLDKSLESEIFADLQKTLDTDISSLSTNTAKQESTFSNVFGELDSAIFNNIVSENKLYSDEELQQIKKNLDESTDPSKYLDEQMLQNFDNSLIDEDLVSIDGLNLSLIPNNFTLMV